MWKASKAWSVAFQAVGTLFLVAAVVGCFQAWQHGADGMALMRVTIDPARASLGFVLLSIVAPGVFQGRMVRPVHALTFPILFMTMLYALKVVGEGSSPPLTRFGDAPRLDIAWYDWRSLAIVGAFQIIALGTMVFLRRRA
jgi:hypothetical protein